MRPKDDAPGPTRVPLAWRATYLLQQGTVLFLAGVAFLLMTLGSPLYEALLVPLPTLYVPPGIPVPLRYGAPLLAPMVLGAPLLFTRQRAPGLLWLGVMALLCIVAVLEVSRLNWIAFFSGIAFRIESGPVPLVRTFAGLVVLLSGLVLMAHQSVRASVHHLAERGVALADLAATRQGLLALERTLHAAVLAAGIALALVGALSMSMTESAPGDAAEPLLPLLWAGLLLALVAASFALGTWRRGGKRADDGSDAAR